MIKERDEAHRLSEKLEKRLDMDVCRWVIVDGLERRRERIFVTD